MNPSNNSQQSPKEPSVEEWFKGLPADQLITVPPPLESPVPPRKVHSKKPLAIVASIAACLLLLGSGSYAYRHLTTTPCLSAEHYVELTGGEVDEQQSFNTSFYTTSLLFEPNSKAITDSSEIEIKKLADFYKKYNASASIIFTINSEYGTDDLKSVASSQAGMALSRLAFYDVKPDDIQLTTPSKIVSGGEVEQSSLSDHTTTYVSVSSSDVCR